MDWLKKIFLLDFLPVWARVLLVAVGGAIAGLAVLGTEGCRSAVPVVVQQTNYQCQAAVENADGTVDFEQCRVNGHRQESDQGDSAGGAGDEELDVGKLQGAIIRPPCARLN